MEMRRVDELGRTWVRTGEGEDDWIEAGPWVGDEPGARERAAKIVQMHVALRVDTTELDARLAEARGAVLHAVASLDELFDAKPRPATLEGLAAGLDELLDGDDETAAELRTLAEGLDLRPSLASAVDEALEAVLVALCKVSEAKTLVEQEARRRRGPRVQADDIPYETLKALGTPAGAITADTIATDPTTRTVRINPALRVPLFGRVSGEDLSALDAAVAQLNQFSEQAALSREGLRVFTAVDPGAPDAPTLTRADVDAAQEIREAIRAKVEAALGAGRRVNVLEVGNVEWCILGCPVHHPLDVGGEQLLSLTVRRVDAERALSVYHDSEA